MKRADPDAGLGANFEVLPIRLYPTTDCVGSTVAEVSLLHLHFLMLHDDTVVSLISIMQADGSLMAGREVSDWRLTARVFEGRIVFPVYEMDGCSARIRRGDAIPAAQALAADFVNRDELSGAIP